MIERIIMAFLLLFATPVLFYAMDSQKTSLQDNGMIARYDVLSGCWITQDLAEGIETYSAVFSDGDEDRVSLHLGYWVEGVRNSHQGKMLLPRKIAKQRFEDLKNAWASSTTQILITDGDVPAPKGRGAKSCCLIS